MVGNCGSQDMNVTFFALMGAFAINNSTNFTWNVADRLLEANGNCSNLEALFNGLITFTTAGKNNLLIIVSIPFQRVSAYSN
jgi:hypothetical protein